MKILICPLDWGLGHATRCVPVIRAFAERGHEVTVGADGVPFQYLQSELEGIRILKFPGRVLQYSERGAFSGKLLSQLPGFFTGIREEREWVKRNQEVFKWDAILSDNRYGVYHPTLPSFFLSHQIYPPLPKSWMGIPLHIPELIFHKILGGYLKRFDEIYVPDFPGEINLSGKLSKGPAIHPKSKFIGPLSRFTGMREEGNKGPDYLAVISGPEPQRTLFFHAVFHALKNLPGKKIMVSGRPDRGSSKVDEKEGISIYEHLPQGELGELIRSAKVVISRSGYSSIMDFCALKKKNILLVPTPGQPEQEYLAKHLEELAVCPFSTQDGLQNWLKESNFSGYNGFNGFEEIGGTNLLIPRIEKKVRERV